MLEPAKGTLEVSKWFLKLTDGTLQPLQGLLELTKESLNILNYCLTTPLKSSQGLKEPTKETPELSVFLLVCHLPVVLQNHCVFLTLGRMN